MIDLEYETKEKVDCQIFIIQYLFKANGEQVLHVFYRQEEIHPPREQGYRVHICLCRFPREDPSAPRMRIVKKECPPEFDEYMGCLEKNPGKAENCIKFR